MKDRSQLFLSATLDAYTPVLLLSWILTPIASLRSCWVPISTYFTPNGTEWLAGSPVAEKFRLYVPDPRPVVLRLKM